MSNSSGSRSISEILLQWVKDNGKREQGSVQDALQTEKAGAVRRKEISVHAKPEQIADSALYASKILKEFQSEPRDESEAMRVDEDAIDTFVEMDAKKILNSVNVQSIQFGLLSPEEIRLTSVCEITKQRLFDYGAPVDNGLYDLRMGSAQRQFQCASCSLPFKDCPGHFGRIELAAPIFNFIHIEKIIKVLNCICIDCSALLAPKTKRFIERQVQSKRGVDRLKYAHECVKGKLNKQCCGTEAALRYRVAPTQLRFCAFGEQASTTDETANEQVGSIQALEQGCGHYQPKVMREGHRLLLKYPVLPAGAVGGKREIKELAKQAAKEAKKAEKLAKKLAKETGSTADTAAATPYNENYLSAAAAAAPMKDYDRVRHERADTQRYIDAEEVLRIFRRISDEDCWLLGFDPQNGHPAWMIWTVLPVPPPCLRPSIITPNGRKAVTHDELTMTLIEIVKINNKLRKQIQGNIQTFQENYKLLLYNSVVALIDNDGKAFPKAMVSEASQIPRNGIAQRLKGKTGRIRGNMMGKRTDFSARSVITPDANLALNQVGVPKSMALILTYPERVNRHNIARLQTAVLLGPERLAGAKFVIEENEVRWDLKYCKNIKLKIGYVVERHLRDGDLVTMNRQPSLHKESIMAFYVRLMDGNTLRLNLSVCTPFNADFDGDEMNLGVPQSEEARAELLALLEASQCLITPQTNKPSMGLVQDSLLATRLLTVRDAFLTRTDVMQMLMYAPISFATMKLPQPTILKPEPLWTGKQLVSLLLPHTLLLGPSDNRFRPDEEQAGDALTASDCRVLIRTGTLLSGVLDKKFVGVTHGSIIHVLTKDYGADVARTFIEELQGIAQAYVTIVRGFSVGLADCMTEPGVQAAVQDLIKTGENSAREIVRQHNSGELPLLPGRNREQTLEETLRSTLGRAHDKSGRAVKDAMPLHGNNLKLMVTAGSKGGDANIAQISACVGQQNLQGGRIPCMFEGRAMPHSCKNDLYDFESRGWISRSFVQGLTPTQMFAHACGGREGLLDTAVKTAYIGYIQRRLIKAGEDVSVAHDATVRNSAGRIVQFVYGDDGMDGACFEWQAIDFLGMSNSEIDLAYGVCTDNDARVEMHTIQDRKILMAQADRIRAMRDSIRRAVHPLTDTHFPLPNNIARSLVVAEQRQKICNLPLVSIARAAEILLEFEQRLVQAIDPSGAHWQRTCDAIAMYMALIYANLAARLVHEKFSESVLAWLLFDHLIPQYVRARVAAGEASGVLAAQAIGEPATQMTFNSFHSSGRGNAQLMMGVPRLEELIKVGGSIKTPSLTLHLQNSESYARGSEQMQSSAAARARLLAGRLSGANLGSIFRSIEVLFEPIGDQSAWASGARDRAAVDSWYAYEPPLVRASRLEQLGTPLDWVIRIEIARSAAHERSLTPSAIARLIFETYEGSLEVIPSDDNDWSSDERCDGGFVRVRMYSNAVYQSLIACLPEMLQLSIKNLQASAEAAGSAQLSTVTPLRAAKRQKNNSSQKETACAGSDLQSDRRTSIVSGDRYMSASNDLISCAPPPIETLRAESTEGVTDSMIAEIWGQLDARTCVPMMLQHLCKEIQKIELDGIKHITSATVRQQSITLYCKETGALLKKAQEWIIETFDANTGDKTKPHRSLRDTLCIFGVDHSRTQCNNPAEVAEVFGIEAARNCLFRELRNVLQFNGEYVNSRHIEMLCDIMTQSGSLMAVNRHGLNRRQTGPLMRATLEESVTMLTSAGCFSEFDGLTGPSERVATGRRIHSGTGSHIDVLDAPSRKRKSSHISAPSSLQYAEKNCSNECEEEADRPRSGAQASNRYEIRKARDAAAVPRRETSAFAPGYDRNQRFEQADLQNFLNEQRTLAAEKQKIKAQKIGANTAFTEEKMASDLEIFNPFGAKNNTIPAALDYSDAATDFQNPFEANDNKQSQTSVEDIFMQQNASFELGTDTVAGYTASNPTERNSFTAAVLSQNKSKKAVLDPFAHDCAANIFSFAAPQRQIVQQRRTLFYIPSEPVKKE